ncbi:MAG TPA: MFS transporter [Candidatus Nanopelagicaceae bacterium]|nr:MFS transporter [Candidatus Nanopelagicaceae bacterium]
MKILHWRGNFDQLPREVAVLTAVSFSVAIGYGVVVPVIPVFARSFGVGNAAAGAVISTFAFMRLSTGLFGGRLVDRFGERLVLAVGIAIVAASSALAGLAQSYPQLLLLRSLGGIGSSMFTISAASLLLRIVPDDQRGRSQSIYQSGFLIGGITGPAIGGLLATISIRAPFFVYALSLTVAGLIAAIYLSHSRLSAAGGVDIAARTQTEHTSLREALKMQSYLTALVCSFALGWTLFGMRATLVPLLVTEHMKLAPSWTGVAFTVASIAGAVTLLPAGQVSDVRGRRPALLIGITTGIAAFLLLIWSPNIAVVVVAMGLTGIAGSFFGTTPAAVVGDILKGRGGQVIALFQMASDFGSILGPLVAGWLADRYSFRAAFMIAPIILVSALLMAIRLGETRKSHLV